MVPLQIAINPSSTFFAAGEGIRLIVSPNEIVPSPPYLKSKAGNVKSKAGNRGVHVIHAGGEFDSHLLLPVIPRA
ncbi:MAG: hypothetical protein NZ990_02010 [Myxococcota bacterium]|nr:hypothetical protein [Myxococcota bacterium]